MKKLLAAVLILGLAGGAAFAQSCKGDADVQKKQKVVLAEFESAKKMIASQKEWKPTFVFQHLVHVMDNYMALRKLCPEATPELAVKIEVKIPVGWKENATMLVSQFINQNSQVIWITEAQKFDNFAAALEEDKEVAKKEGSKKEEAKK